MRNLFAFDRSLADTLVFDKASARTMDIDGRMHVEMSNISKAAVNPYYGREIPGYKELGLDANKVYQMLRHPDELEKAAPTFRCLPLMIVHRPIAADDHPKELVVGTIGSEVTFDGTYLKAPLAIWTAEGIAAVKSKAQQEISCGYRYKPDMTPGTFEGQAYDGVMRDIMGNHVTLVERGRAGRDVLVSDSNFLGDLSNMRNAQFLAKLKAFLAQDADLKALDAVITARDAERDEDEEEDDPDAPGQKRKKKPAMDKAALDAALIEATKGFVAKSAMDTAIAEAVAATRKEASELHAAREAVKPIVGAVTLDSATAVYEFALKHLGVTLDGVHASAYPSLFALATAKKPKPAMDSNTPNALLTAIPGLSRLVA